MRDVFVSVCVNARVAPCTGPSNSERGCFTEWECLVGLCRPGLPRQQSAAMITSVLQQPTQCDIQQQPGERESERERGGGARRMKSSDFCFKNMQRCVSVSANTALFNQNLWAMAAATGRKLDKSQITITNSLRKCEWPLPSILCIHVSREAAGEGEIS